MPTCLVQRSWTQTLSGAFAGIGLCLTAIVFPAISTASDTGIRFDVPQLVEAQPVAVADGSPDRVVTLELSVSVIIDSLTAPRIDQLMVEITPRGGSAIVVDYAPRTELSSDYSGGIEVRQTDEATLSGGVSIDARYSPFAGGNVSGGHAEKNSASVSYNRVAPVHVIAASGTTRRGRGVYFKFRSTDQQIIEGERVLQVSLRVPATWGGDLLDVVVIGDSRTDGASAGFAAGLPTGLSSWAGTFRGQSGQSRRVGEGRFLVAAFRSDDLRAETLAKRLADAESLMRSRFASLRVADRRETVSASSPASLLRHVSRRFDWSTSDRSDAVSASDGAVFQPRSDDRAATGQVTGDQASLLLHQALDGSLDPHSEPTFGSLPAEVRRGCLAYLSARADFTKSVAPLSP